MRPTSLILTLAALALPVAGHAQRPAAPPPQQQQEQMQRLQRLQDMQQHMDRLLAQVRETNQQMVQQRARDEFQKFGQQMEQAGDRLRQMLREMDQLHRDPELVRDRDRLRAINQLGERVRNMVHEMEAAHEALRKLAVP